MTKAILWSLALALTGALWLIPADTGSAQVAVPVVRPVNWGDHSGYWRGYWGWYDRSYAPYYYRQYGYYGPRTYYRPYYYRGWNDWNGRYYGRYYGPYRGYYGAPGVGVRVGPFGVGVWR